MAAGGTLTRGTPAVAGGGSMAPTGPCGGAPDGGGKYPRGGALGGNAGTAGGGGGAST